MAPPSLRALYRLQLATARHFDAQPALKALLSLLGGGDAAVAAQLRRFLGDAEGGGGAPAPYAPPRSLAAFVRAAYRAPQPPAGRAAAEAAEAAGVACQRELVRLADLCTVWAAAGGGGGGGGPGGVAGALPGGLAEADAIRPGALLVEHPAALQPGRGVLLITDIARRVRGDGGGGDVAAGEEPWELRALTLNRPLPRTVGGAFPALAASLGPLAALPLFFGGPAGGDALYVLHRFPGVPGAVPVDGPPPEGGSAEAAAAAAPAGARCGLFLGGDVEALGERVARGGAGDVRVCVGHVELPLREEAGGGLSLPGAERLLVAAGSGAAAQALCAPLQPPPAAAAAAAARGGYDVARYWHQNAAWARAVAQLGAHVETEEPLRGRELAAFAAPEAHAAVAHYAAAGWTAKDLEGVLG
jgi:hypothetical protein